MCSMPAASATVSSAPAAMGKTPARRAAVAVPINIVASFIRSAPEKPVRPGFDITPVTVPHVTDTPGGGGQNRKPKTAGDQCFH